MKQVFPMIPAPASAIAVPVVVALLLLAGSIFFSYLAYATRTVRFEISAIGLTIKGDLYGRTIPAHDLVIDQARPLDLGTEPGLQLIARENGTSLPGYRAGWFATQNGTKALAFVTDRKHVVCIPTRDGYTLLLSVADPQGFLTTLRQTIAAA